MTAAAKPKSRAATSASSSARPAARAKRLGKQVPRLWTRPLRDLTPETSLGFEAIEFADWVWEQLQIEAERRGDPEIAELLPRLLEWQRWLLIHALELLPGPRMIFRFRTVLLLVARQNGKTVLMVYLILWRLFNDGAKLIIGTAQTVDIAEEAWQLVVDVAEAVPDLEQQIAQNRGIVRRASKFALQLETREKYRLAAASRKGGRGMSGGELVLLDELREHTSWASWSAVSKTIMAKARGQVWGISNAGDAASIVLAYLRKMALMGIDGPEALEELEALGALNVELGDIGDEQDEIDADSIFLAEWSAKPKASKWDRDAWADANPSLGYTDLDERAIAAAASTDPDWIFSTEVLCRFVNLVGTGPFPTGSWFASLDTADGRRKRGVVRDASRPAEYCVDVSHDRTMAYIAIAFWDTEGRARVEIAAQRAGVDWVVPWLLSPNRRVPVRQVALQGRGAPVSALAGDEDHPGPIRKAEIPIVAWEGGSLSAGCGQFYDAIRRANADDDQLVTLTHGEQPALDIAANTAKIKPLGDGWAVDRTNSPEDAAPLMAAIGAYWLLLTNPTPTRSAYEDHDLMVV